MKNEFTLTNDESITEHLNLGGRMLRIASLKSLPFQDVYKVDDSQFIGEGFSFEIVQQLSQHFNFTYDVVVPEDEDFGMLINGSSWTGLMGMLIDKSADMAAAPISVTHARQKVVTFSSSLYKDSLGVIFPRQEGRQNNHALLAPFTKQVWIIILVLALTICPILYALVNFSKYLLAKSKCKKNEDDLSFFDCFWFVYSGLMKQGFNKSSSFNPVRLLMASWWLTSMVITAFYTANLTAFMTLENSITEQTVEKLVQSGDRWVFKKGTAFSNTLFKEKVNEDTQEFSELKRSYINGMGIMVQTDEEAMDYVRKGYSYIQEVNALNYLLFKDFQDSNGQCQFTVLDLHFFKHSTAFAFPNGSPYANSFSKYIEFLQKSGLIQKWMQQHLLSADVCAFHSDNKLSRNEQALTVQEFFTAFCILCVGTIFGLIICFIEVNYLCIITCLNTHKTKLQSLKRYRRFLRLIRNYNILHN